MTMTRQACSARGGQSPSLGTRLVLEAAGQKGAHWAPNQVAQTPRQLRPRRRPGNGVGQGSGPGDGPAGPWGGTPPRGCPGRLLRCLIREYPQPRPLRASPLPPTLRRARRAGGRDVGTHVPGRGPAAGAPRAAGGGAGGPWCPQGPRAWGSRIALAGRRRGRRQPEPHGAGRAGAGGGRARGAAPPRPPPEPWAQAAQHSAAEAAGGAGRVGGQRAAGGGGDGGGGRGPARAGGRAAHVTQTRAPHPAAGRGGGGAGAEGARPPAGPPPPHTPSRCSRGKGTHRPGGRARRAGVVPRSGRGWGCWALRREPDGKAENHFIARVLGRGTSREGTHSRLHPGERLRGARFLGLGEARVVAAAAASAVAPAGAWLGWPCRREHRGGRHSDPRGWSQDREEGAGWSRDRPGSGPSVVVDGCDDPILFIHEATVHLLQLPARGLQ